MTGSGGPASGSDAGEARDPARGTPEERLRALGADDADAGPADRTGRTGSAPPPGDAEAGLAAHLASLPAPPLPAHVLARIDRALAAERASGSAGDPGARATARRGTPRRAPGARGGVLLLAGVVAALLLAVGLGTLRSRDGSSTAAPVPPTGPVVTASPPAGPPGVGGAEAPVLGRADLPRALRSGLGAADPGPLSDPRRLTACLGAQPLPAAAPVLGARRVVLDGTPGVLLVLPTGTVARFRLLVVGDDCAADRPSTLSDTVVGR